MTENQERKDFSPDQITALERSLSSDRFNSYVTQAKGDRKEAIRLYEHNTELSEALYGVIQRLEITLRNSIDRILRQGIGFEDWYDHTHLESAEADSLRLAKKAVEDLHKPVTPPRVIAKINFGFWVRLTASIYEKDLWVPHLYKIFPMRMKRSLLNKRLLKIKELRNQIAHHERISKRDLQTDYEEIIETIKWLCPITSNWVKETN
jgi:Abi-like protein